MKSTKRILSAILSVVMILGCLTVGFTAQASASDLVAAVAAGGDVNWTGGNVTLADTLVINGDVKVDFNGAVITGPAGKVAIRVDGGNVRLYDGVVLADQGKFSGEMAFVKALMNYKPAISINNGNVELNCMTAVGSLLRIPNSGTIEVPIGNGINANGGNVTIDNVIAIGMKALDNTNAKVVVKDAILAGIYKAVNIYNKVDFGKDYVQYETVELLEGFLNEGVNLSANEKKYIASATNSQGDFSVGSVIVNVAKPEFNAPTTTFVDGKLNVFSVVEEHEHYGVSNRYSYSYTPDTATIGDKEVAFKGDGAQYVASFDAEAGKEYDVEINYDLSIKLGKKQKEIVQKAFDIVEHYIDKAPELLNRFVVDFEHIYAEVENLFGLAFNAIVKDKFFSGAAYDKLLAIIYALEGQEYNGSSENGKDDSALINGGPYQNMRATYNSYYLNGQVSYADVEAHIKSDVAADIVSKTEQYGAIFDTNGDGVADSLFAYTNDSTFDEIPGVSYANTKFGNGTPGYGSGKGLLDVFDDYYEDIMGYIYGGNTTEFKDLGGAAYYVGYNWEGILALVENAVVLIDEAYDVINGKEFKALLDNLGKGGFASYVGYFNTAYNYLGKVMNRVDEVKDSSFAKTFLKDKTTAATYCKKYALKVWNIANNPETYFNINVPANSDYVVVDLRDEALNKTFTVSTKEKPVYVSVAISGYGHALINGEEIATVGGKNFSYGEDIVVEPKVINEDCQFSYMIVESDGKGSVVDGNKFTAKAATNLKITLVFKQKADDTNKEIVFMTDDALSYKFLAKVTGPAAEIAFNWDYDTQAIEAPAFTGMKVLGWSLDKEGSEVASLDELGETVAAAAENKDIVIVYAIYEYDENTTVGEHGKTVMFNKVPYAEGGLIYFELSIQLRGEKKAIESGVILTVAKEEGFDYAKEMTVDKSGTSGYVFSRTDEFDANGFVQSDVLLTVGVKSSKTVYARGYVVWEDGTVTYTADIVSGSVA